MAETSIVAGALKSSFSTGVGTTVVSDQSAVLERVFWGGTYTGTAIIHDASSATGTTATSAVLTLGLPLTQYPKEINMGIGMRNGIVVQATGTPVITVVWNK